MPVRWLRERLCEHVAWFQEVPRRLADAQAAIAGDQLWPRRVAEASDRLQDAVDVGEPRALPDADAGERLFALEVYDRAAWHVGGNMRLVPVEIIDVADDAYHVVRLVGPRQPRTALQSGRLSSHLRYHAVIPTTVHASTGARYPVTIKTMTAASRLDGRRGAMKVKVAAMSFGDGCAIRWQGGRALDVAGADEREVRLIETLAAAGRDGVDVLVVPELTVPPAVRDRAIEALRWQRPPVALVVPGSFHEACGDRHHNRALLVDGQGNVVIEHRKLARYGDVGAGDAEVIDPGDGITAVVTPIGLVAIAICLDFCDADVGEIWRALQPEWMLVPAYGGGLSAHMRAAHQISLTSATVSIVAHEAAESTPGHGSFVHSTGRDPVLATESLHVVEIQQGSRPVARGTQ